MKRPRCCRELAALPGGSAGRLVRVTAVPGGKTYKTFSWSDYMTPLVGTIGTVVECEMCVPEQGCGHGGEHCVAVCFDGDDDAFWGTWHYHKDEVEPA